MTSLATLITLVSLALLIEAGDWAGILWCIAVVGAVALLYPYAF